MRTVENKPAPSEGAGRKSNARGKPNATAKGNTAAPERQPLITFEDFAVIYLEYSRMYNAPKTIKGKERYIKRFVAFFGYTPLVDITRVDVTGYIVHRKEIALASKIVINREITVLRHLFNYAFDMDYVKNNPTGRTRRFPESPRPIDPPTAAEIKTFLAWCLTNDPLLHALVTVAAYTGLRKGDILGMKGKDIDLDRRLLKITVSKTGEEQYIPLNDKVLTVLAKRKGNTYIFPSSYTRLAVNNVPIKRFDRRFRTAKKATGLEFRFHDLRHAFAFAVLDAGANIRTVQKLLGHAKLTTTERYLAVTDTQKRDAIEALDW